VIVDCCLWFNEWDALKWRLQALEDLVDVFVVVEGDRSFQGEPKSWRLTDRWDEFARWSDRMIWEQVDLSGDRWERQRQQRRAMRERAKQAGPADDDVVVFSDVEEVWGPEMLDRWPDTIVAAEQDMRVLRPEWRRNTSWPGSIGGPWRLMRSEDWQGLRNRRFELPKVGSGWHLTWMGGAEACRTKAQALSDDKYRNVDFVRLLAERRWVDGPLSDVGDRPAGVPDTW
jgi:hypothetical protein